MILNENYTVTIDKLVNGGKGLARLDNFPVFIANSVPEDVLKIKITSINKNYASAEIVEIITPSKYRTKPVCAMFNVCGSCDWQQIDYQEQLSQKKLIVYETIKNITGQDFHINDVIPSPKTNEYRCKVQYPVSQRKKGRIISGYYKKLSHDLVNIKYCPMHESIINEIMEFIKEKAQNLEISGYNESRHEGTLRHVIFRQSSFDKKLLIILVVNDKKISEKLLKLSELIINNYSEIVGICVNFNPSKTNVILGLETKTVFGNGYYDEKLSNITYRVSANSFFQVNPYSAEVIFNIVKDIISSRITKPSILDAYSGVSSFGIWLSSIASKVVSVEEVISASKDALYNAKINSIDNIEVINGDASVKFAEFIKNNITFDVVLIDPPRKGSSEAALNNVINLADKYVVYVSCNPATLARDIKYLLINGFSPEFLQPVDMFPNTSHIETIVLLKKHKKEA